MNEFDIIKNFFAPLANNETARALKDDAADWQPPKDCDVVLSVDAMTAGVHFPAHAAPQIVAARLVATALSDLAAKGATPQGCLLTLCLPREHEHYNDEFIKVFAAAFGAALQKYNLQLWGGDTISGDSFVVSLNVVGVVPHGEMILRSGAAVGDDIYMSGSCGKGFVGLKEMNADYTAPTPRLELGQGLRGVASAAADVSDGLLADLQHIALASECSMQLQLADIPLATSSTGGDYPLDDLLSGGDDYELIFTAAPTARKKITALSTRLNLPLTRIGTCTALSTPNTTPHISLHNPDNSTHPLPKTLGFTHH